MKLSTKIINFLKQIGQKCTTLLLFLKKNWKKVLLFLILAWILVAILKPKGFDPAKEQVELVKQDVLKKTVLATGTVTSIVDLNLGFNSPGIVSSVQATVGQKVKKGQILASLQAKTELGALNQALGALKAAQALLQKTKEGSTSEEVAVAEASVRSAQVELENVTRREEVNVQNAWRNLTSSSLVLVPKDSGSSSAQLPTISGTYSGSKEGLYTITVFPSGSGYTYTVSGLSSSNGQVTTAFSVPLGTDGLYIKFPESLSGLSQTSWTLEIPNKQSVSYTTNYNAYKSALENKEANIKSAQAILDSRQAELTLKKAQARPADLLAREADVLSAQGRVESAQGAYEDKVIRAPADGVITKVDIDPGENVDAKKAVIVLQDDGELFLDANVNESAISEIKEGQQVTFSVDTVGPTEEFSAHISHVDLAPTLDGDIVNYKVKAKIDTESSNDRIKAGSTANLSILIFEKPSVVVAPNRVVIKKDNKSSVLLVTSEVRGKTKEIEVSLGEVGDGGLVEVKSGLAPGDKVLFRSKTK